MREGFIEKGYMPEKSDYEKIRKFTRRDFGRDELYVFEVSLCNNDVDRDNEKFSVSALKELAKQFVGKTGIKNHSMRAEDQSARIFDAYVERVPGKKTVDGEDFYALRAKAYMVRSAATDQLITDIDAGIKKEVSVSCSAGKRICSVCGKDKNVEYCGHVSGKTYDGKKCFTVLDGITDAYEFSVVAVPAQREAGVEKSYDASSEKHDIEKMLSGSGSITLTRSQADSIKAMISGMSDDAELGREYRKNIINDLVHLCGKALPNMDKSAFESVAQIMTAKELFAFKNAFEGSASEKSIPMPQLAKNQSGKRADLGKFKI